MAIRRCLFCPTFLSPTNGGRVPPKFNSIGMIGNFDPEDFLLKSIASQQRQLKIWNANICLQFLEDFLGQILGHPIPCLGYSGRGQCQLAVRSPRNDFPRLPSSHTVGGTFFFFQKSVLLFFHLIKGVFTPAVDLWGAVRWTRIFFCLNDGSPNITWILPILLPRNFQNSFPNYQSGLLHKENWLKIGI